MPQHTPSFAQCTWEIRRELESMTADRGVEEAVIKGELLDVHELKAR